MRWDSSRHFHVTDKYPVTIVSWNDCQAFCEWLSKKLGKKVTLPTQAQWEYACRAGSTKRFSFGNSVEQITHFANVPSRTESFRILVNDGQRNLSLSISEDFSRISIIGGVDQTLAVEPDRSSGSAKTIKRLTVTNNSNSGLTIDGKFIQQGQQVTIEPEKILSPYGAHVYIKRTLASRWQSLVTTQGGILFVYRVKENEWGGNYNYFSVPKLESTNKVEVENLDSDLPIQLKTPAGLVTLNPRERRIVNAFPSQYWSDSEDGYPNQLAPVGQFEPNAFGLYDMHGNVWEWCQDGFDLDYSKKVQLDPKGSKFSEFYAIRGGCYM